MEFKELNKKEMGARIRARREAMNMSRSELGALLSVTGKFIADIDRKSTRYRIWRQGSVFEKFV